MHVCKWNIFLMFGIFIINLGIKVIEGALNMVILSRLFLHLTDKIPMQRCYVVVGVLAGVVFLQFLVIIGMRLSSKRSNPTKATITQYSNGATNTAYT